MLRKVFWKAYDLVLNTKVGRFIRKSFLFVFKHISYTYLYPRTYKKFAKKPIDMQKVVFVEVKDHCISNSFKLLYDRLSARDDIKVSCHFIDSPRVGTFQLIIRSYKMIKDIATARCVFVNDSSTVMGSFEPRENTKIIQTWHGCGAFKKWGFSTADLIFGESEKTMRRYPNHKNYSLVTISSEEVAWAYAEAFDIRPDSGIIQPMGVSRTDIFYDKKEIQKAWDAVFEAVPQARGKKILLYAPTFRGRVKKAQAPNVLDIEQLQAAIGDEYVLLIKQHGFVKRCPKVPEEFGDFAFDVTKLLPIDYLLMTADICISDYSSLIFEYSLFERPMLFLAHDIDTYCDWRGFYYDYREFVPGPIVYDTDGVISFVENIDEHFDRQRVIDFKKKFMSACDGHATDRIIAFALDEEYKPERELTAEAFK